MCLRQTADKAAHFIQSHFCQPNPAIATTRSTHRLCFNFVNIALACFGIRTKDLTRQIMHMPAGAASLKAQLDIDRAALWRHFVLFERGKEGSAPSPQQVENRFPRPSYARPGRASCRIVANPRERIGSAPPADTSGRVIPSDLSPCPPLP